MYIIRQSGWKHNIRNRLAQNELIKWDYSLVSNNN
jgi:hypothetical protein